MFHMKRALPALLTSGSCQQTHGCVAAIQQMGYSRKCDHRKYNSRQDQGI